MENRVHQERSWIKTRLEPHDKYTGIFIDESNKLLNDDLENSTVNIPSTSANVIRLMSRVTPLWQAVCSKIQSLQYMFNPLNNGFI